MAREPDRLDANTIREIVQGLIAGTVFTASQLPPEEVGMVFMPIGLGGIGDLDPNMIGNIIEDVSKASPRSVNGWPIFTSCRIIHKDDWAIIVETALAAQQAIDSVMDGDPR